METMLSTEDLLLLSSEPHLPHWHLHSLLSALLVFPTAMLSHVPSAPCLPPFFPPSIHSSGGLLSVQALSWGMTLNLPFPTKWLLFLLSFHRANYLLEPWSQCIINVFALKNYKDSEKCRGLYKTQTLLCLLTCFSYSPCRLLKTVILTPLFGLEI